MNQSRIVIVGGGAGGLELATKLGKKLGRKKKAEIILIDASPVHLWKPRLHEVAAGVLNANIDELSYAAHGRHCHFRYVLGRMHGLDRKAQTVKLAAHCDDAVNAPEDRQILPEREVRYDYLVLALGSQTNDFDTAGAREHCIFLDNRRAAEHFHQSFLNVYLRASQKNTDRQPQKFAIAIVGAGATGVELAAELNHTAHQLNHYGFDGIKPENVEITLIEAADRVMPALSEKASAAIARQLQKLNIRILSSERVTEVTDSAVITGSGKTIPAQLKVWSAGIKAPALLGSLDGLEANRINQLAVTSTLQTTRDQRIFAIGDCAHFQPPNSDRPVPPRAQAASQQASLLVRALPALLNGSALPEFRYRDKGSLISLSRHSSVGQLMGNLSGDFTFEGKLARLFYITLYRLHQIALHGVFKTGLLLLRDRLNHRTGPTMKLH
ncbi:NAD(P)/FAD-dependent oxidoreductase [Exilibacterium tricleocarpae]|uniref:NAD(P)/FAD-dependent oxidoreductase n=1 Tax=Exilibacterium tricleocarpae TaxID=2591008 RepID=A0A545TS74_9GAMM|nr:NAD(P)/FAD-dependent oxidoreductase [Exilibacterium tricleocarpae]TQV80066.1 NAD(P)/FAD-dependent oxidoreductase [Exilibacterium tricleocarpae]